MASDKEHVIMIGDIVGQSVEHGPGVEVTISIAQDSLAAASGR